MIRWVTLSALIAVMMSAALPAVAEGRRVALVIGNQAYTGAGLPELRNTINDARLIGGVLSDLGFEVIDGYDLGESEMADLLDEFGTAARGAEIGLVYFSGHGMQHQGRNYFFPVDASPTRLSGLARESFGMAEFMDQLQFVSDLKIAIFDACRDHRLLEQLAAAEPEGARSALSKGMARPGFTPAGSIIAFATAANDTASDGTTASGNSPYAAALAKHLPTPGEEVGFVFRLVHDEVYDATDGDQQPESVMKLGREKHFLAAAAPPPTTSLAPLVETAPQDFAARLLAAGQGASLKECPDCPEMVAIPDGSFRMGSPESEEDRQSDEGPTRTVRVSRFALGRDAITVGEFRRFARATGRNMKGCYAASGSELGWVDATGWEDAADWEDPGFSQGEDHPVVCISWEDAQAYVAWLNDQVEGAPYRLPSEAEQEYVLRADHGEAAYPWGGGKNAGCGAANGADQSIWSGLLGRSVSSCNDGHVFTAPVDAFPANRWGVRQLSGNTWEWAEDCWNSDYGGAPTNGDAWMSGDCSRAVLRGGAWFAQPQDLRSAIRIADLRDIRSGNLGFRVARTLGFPD